MLCISKSATPPVLVTSSFRRDLIGLALFEGSMLLRSCRSEVELKEKEREISDNVRLDLSIAFVYIYSTSPSIITYKKQTENSGVGQ